MHDDQFLICLLLCQFLGEVILKALTATQASSTRDSIVRNIYKRVFEWALSKINTSLQPATDAALAPTAAVSSCVGILDIFGFENLGVNSFEQLCINYSSEVMHKVRCLFLYLSCFIMC